MNGNPRVSGADDRVLLFADSLDQQATPAAQLHQWEPWLTVRLDREKLALPVAAVLEVVRPQAITRVPHAPFAVCGVTSLRGAVLAVVDLRVRLGLAAKPIGATSRIVVVSSKGRRIGVLVESAEQVVSIDALQIEKAPEDVLSDRSYYVRGVYRQSNELLILLALDEVLQIRAVDDRALEAKSEGTGL